MPPYLLVQRRASFQNESHSTCRATTCFQKHRDKFRIGWQSGTQITNEGMTTRPNCALCGLPGMRAKRQSRSRPLRRVETAEVSEKRKAARHQNTLAIGAGVAGARVDPSAIT